MLIWPGQTHTFHVYYTPKTSQEPSFLLPLQFSFNGQICGIGQLRSKVITHSRNEIDSTPRQ
jgi:hypothetical protein